MKRLFPLPLHFPLLIAAFVTTVQAAPSLAQATSAVPALPVTVLMQSPAETKTDLQIFCLFESSPANVLHGSLTETDTKLHGLLSQLRKPGLFNGDLGETVVLTPPEGTLAAKKVLIIGLGDSATFTPERMYLVGKIALREANRLGVAHPFFAPTVLDGGVAQYTTGQVAEKVVHGFRDALATEALLRAGNSAGPVIVTGFTYLAGPKFAKDTEAGIDRALGEPVPSR